MKNVPGLALLLFAGICCARETGLPRPKDLPASVPADAAIRPWSDQGEGGLLEISWGHSSMLWAEPCRSPDSANKFARGQERILNCPVEIDMKVRPQYLGTLSVPMTKDARDKGATGTCCYNFSTLGNR